METLDRVQTLTHATSLAEYHSFRSIMGRRIYDAVTVTTPDMLRMALRHASMGGKRIRPMLTLISTQAVGGNPENSLDAAVAVEFLHASSLVHDDIMDGSDLRRGKPTVHALFGRSMAILAGDMLLALAFRSIARVAPSYSSRALDLLTEAFAETCEGQGYDILEIGRRPARSTSRPRPERVVDPSGVVDRNRFSGAGGNAEIETRQGERGKHNAEGGTDHLLMVEKKTARLIEAAAALGGLLGGAPAECIEALRGFGYNIGMAYQAKDDLLDVIASEDVTGKSVGVDTRNGRTTFATLAGGGESEVEELVSSYTDRAFEFLERLPPTRHRENLKALAEALVGRSM